ncbi:N-acetylmuramoyl-L-alanine amidase [Roseovarius albus]|nr:N-acetylmuramoyl-L-alanine amidase [Roseovarius albus]
MNGKFSRNLKYILPMMQGIDVHAIQTALMRKGILHLSDVDGLFGPGTERVVKHFQRQRGLDPDGIVGKITFAALEASVPPAQQPGAETGSTTPTAAHRAVPASWMPKARMNKIILHWTAGSHEPNSLDKKHYHILIDGDGELHRGNHAISANVPPLRSKSYAAHTLNCNSHSIGVSLCAMGGDVRESPFRPGPFPITSVQWSTLAQVAAELCLRYDIPVSRKTVLGHGEVQKNLNIKQKGKWDPLALPWDPDRPYSEIGDQMREMVADNLDALKTPKPVVDDTNEVEEPPTEVITLDGTELEGAAMDGRTWIKLSDLAVERKWPDYFVNLDEDIATITEPSLRFEVLRTADEGGAEVIWVEAADVSERLGLAMHEAADGSIHLNSVAQEQATKTVIVRRGQVPTQIARIHLGDASRWKELRTKDGQFLNEQVARRLRVGQVLLLPDDSETAGGTTQPQSTGTPLSKKEIGEIANKIAKLEGGGASMQQKRRVAVDAILAACVKNNVNDLSHQAYILATAYHETNLGQFMEELWGPTAAQRGYEGRSDLGNSQKGDGFRYRGRGFVQITGRHNYTKYGKLFKRDFVNKPEMVETPMIAAEILVRGMSEIGFTGRGLLADLGLDGDFDWFNARGLINGDRNHGGDKRYSGLKKGEGIARKARQYRDIIATA